MRDYRAWHEVYDDPDSGMSWRLGVVQGYLREAFDARTGPVRVLSVCAGDGRDVLGVLGEFEDADRFSVTLIELDPELSDRARLLAAGLPANVEVRTTDAGTTDAFTGTVPADVVLLVGIFGNISDDDIRRTIGASPQLCAPGADLLWSRGRHDGDRNEQIRGWFADADFTELDYATHDVGSHPALGRMRYDGSRRPLEPGHTLFTFVR